jgi:hypothetical protein
MSGLIYDFHDVFLNDPQSLVMVPRRANQQINVVANIATTFHKNFNALEVESDQTLVEFEINTQYTISDEKIVQRHLPKNKNKSQHLPSIL